MLLKMRSRREGLRKEALGRRELRSMWCMTMPCWWQGWWLICFGLRGQGLAKAGDSRCALPADFGTCPALQQREVRAPYLRVKA
jgi:hypothetical protein